MIETLEREIDFLKRDVSNSKHHSDHEWAIKNCLLLQCKQNEMIIELLKGMKA